MKPKTIELILSELMLATSGVIKKYGNPTVHPPEANKELDEAFHEALAQIQQLLEECAPEEKKFTYSDIYGDDPRNNYGYGEERYRDGATYGYAKSIDQYKSNIRGKIK